MDGLGRALELYLSRPDSHRVGFALILNTYSYARAIDPGSSQAFLEAEAARLLDPRYETVMGGRPLVYVMSDLCQGEYRARYCSPWLFQELSRRVKDLSGSTPYYVYLTPSASRSADDASYLGMHALSSYAVSPAMMQLAEATTPYSTFAERIRDGYEDAMRGVALGHNLDVVPFASAGWDPGPRLGCPETINCWQSYYSDERVAAAATPGEIAAHVRSVAEWAGYHAHPRQGAPRATSPAASVLIYAWNEFDEGGWLAPTLGADLVTPDPGRINALQRVLRPSCR